MPSEWALRKLRNLPDWDRLPQQTLDALACMLDEVRAGQESELLHGMYRHRKQNSYYDVICEGRVSASTSPLIEGDTAIAYQGSHGDIHIRQKSEFLDGRFQFLRSGAPPVPLLVQYRHENDSLRAIAAKVMPCHYCHVDDIGRCPHGFPGCSLADDLAGSESSANAQFRKLMTFLSEKAPEAYKAYKAQEGGFEIKNAK